MLSKMTQEEFFEILKRTPRSWEKEGGFILAKSEDPITAVARQKLGDAITNRFYEDLYTIIKELGLDRTHGDEIALAMFGYHDLRASLIVLRKQLLEACGLPPD